MRITIDTNILISATIFPNELFVKQFADILNQHTLVLPTVVIEEFLEVASRKFPHKLDSYHDFFESLDYELFPTPETYCGERYPEIRDKKDEPILVSLIQSDVDAFITGDADFHALLIDRPLIMRISEFHSLHCR